MDMKPKCRVLVLGFLLLLAAFGLIIERYIDAARNDALIDRIPADWSTNDASSNHALWISRHMNVPNAHHVWWGDPFVQHSDMQMLDFAHHYIQVNANWSALCVMDSNNDGILNGQHLGDPCCRWRPSKHHFAVQAEHEYRRWHLSHPSEERAIALNHMNETLMVKDYPRDCRKSYNPAAYKGQFSAFYYYKADAAHEETEYNPLKLMCLIVMLAVLVHWVICRDILRDVVLFNWTRTRMCLPLRVRIAVLIVSFLYMDMSSGVIHLILDFAPHHLPGIGGLARGFQHHHHDPTGIILISWYEYVSHIHLLVPLIIGAALLSDASRLQRLFWFWGGAWAHLFQTSHRWAHTPPARLPWIVKVMQSAGLLLSHERHMNHHEDLEHQHTLLSGHTDVILDTLSLIVPPARYDLWFVFGVFWFLLPVYIDVICRDAVHKLQGGDYAQCRLDKVANKV